MFKPGDKVKRVGSDVWDVVYGGVYTVAECTWNEVCKGYDLEIVGSSKEYNAHAFVLAEDTAKYHKHHDLIIAWAKGAEIEFYASFHRKWKHVPNPHWCFDNEYRIKPTNPHTDEIADIESEMRKLADKLAELRRE